MGMTMTQKILAAHAGLDHVEAGQLIEAKLDVVMANDITGPMALPILKQMSDTVFDKNKVVFVPDHFTPNKDIKSAENSKAIREFAKAQGLHWYFEQGKSGVEHAILPEAGVVAAGELVIINDRFGVRIEKVNDSSSSEPADEHTEAAPDDEAPAEDFDYSDFEVEENQ